MRNCSNLSKMLHMDLFYSLHLQLGLPYCANCAYWLVGLLTKGSMSVEDAVGLLMKNILSFSYSAWKSDLECVYSEWWKQIALCPLMLTPNLWCTCLAPCCWVLPLSCNNTPQCYLKYSWPGKPITLTMSGLLIATLLWITLTSPLPYIHQITCCVPLRFWLHFAQPPGIEAWAQHPTVSLLKFSLPLVHSSVLFIGTDTAVQFFDIQNAHFILLRANRRFSQVC